MLFHVLYYCTNADSRRQLCRQLFSWTVGGGVVAILMDRHDDGPQGIHKVCMADNAAHQIPSYDHWRTDLIDIGFQSVLEYEFRYSRDWSDPDPDLLRFIQLVRNVQLRTASISGSSLDDIREAMHRQHIDQKTEGRTVFGVFKKVIKS